jgi:tetratricopeptide (TPR) repeat protein
MYQLLAALLAVTAVAEPLDREQIRKLLVLPKCESLNTVALESSGRVLLADSDAYLSEECAAAERAVKANPDDPDRLRILAEIYGWMNEIEKAKSTAPKAAELYKAALEKRPDDGLMLARYAKCIRWAERLDEADAALRRAITLCPNESECWRIRAEILLARSMKALDQDTKAKEFPADLSVIARDVREGKITEATVESAKELYDEAFRCFDRAVELAPKNREAWISRTGYRMSGVPVSFARSCLRGVPFNPEIPEAYGRDSVLDLRRASGCLPDDFRVLGSLACLELSVGNKSSRALPLDSIENLSADSRTTVRRAIGELCKIAAGENLRDATDAAEFLGVIRLRTTDAAAADDLLEGISRRNPSLDGVWEVRLSLANHRPIVSPDEVLTICRNKFRHKDSSRNRYLLARAYEQSEMPAEALRVLEEGLQKDPTDYFCNIGVAILLTKRDGPGDLSRAKDVKKRAISLVQLPREQEKLFSCLVLHIAQSRLLGEDQEVKKSMAMAEEMGWSTEQMQELRQIAGPQPLLPPPGIGVIPMNAQRTGQ